MWEGLTMIKWHIPSNVCPTFCRTNGQMCMPIFVKKKNNTVITQSSYHVR